MMREDEEEYTKMESQAKYDLLLAHPEVYREVYPEEDPDYTGGGWDVPQNDEDVKKMLADIKASGIL